MDSILIMQEAYSETPCFLMSDDALCPVGSYAAMIEDMTGGKAGLSSQGKDPGCSGIPEAEDEYRMWMNINYGTGYGMIRSRLRRTIS